MGWLMYNNWRNKDGTPKTEYLLGKFSDTPAIMKNLSISLCSKFSPSKSSTKDKLLENLESLRFIAWLNKTEMEIWLSKEHPLVSVNDEEYEAIKNTVNLLMEKNNAALLRDPTITI